MQANELCLKTFEFSRQKYTLESSFDNFQTQCQGVKKKFYP